MTTENVWLMKGRKWNGPFKTITMKSEGTRMVIKRECGWTRTGPPQTSILVIGRTWVTRSTFCSSWKNSTQFVSTAQKTSVTVQKQKKCSRNRRAISSVQIIPTCTTIFSRTKSLKAWLRTLACTRANNRASLIDVLWYSSIFCFWDGFSASSC